MTRMHQSLLAGAALALVLPSLAVAQEATTGNAGPAVEPNQTTQDTIVTMDSVAATTETTTGETVEETVTDVQVTSAEEAMSLENWTYDELYASGISIGQITGAEVYGITGEDVGDVDDVLFDMDGQILSVVARMNDGFLGMGRTHVNIPWDMVSAETWQDGLVIPFTEDELDAHAMPLSETGGRVVGSEDVAELPGGAFQGFETGPNVWRATELLNNTARLREGDTFANYGLVSDIVLQGDRIAAVLVMPDPSFGATGGVYGYPYAGTQGWTRVGMDGTVGTAADGTTVATDTATRTGTAANGTMGTAGTYDLPYDRTQVEMLQPFDPAMLTD